MKFKVGDKVRILDGSNIEGYVGKWVPEMKSYVGNIVSIEGVSLGFFGTGYYLSGCDAYVWDERGLELVKNEQISIFRKENKVIALNKATGKMGVAKCSPEDKFDFSIGAKLAFERLIGESETKEIIDEPKFKVGDIVEVFSKQSTIPFGTRGIIKKVEPNFCLVDFHFEYEFTHNGEGLLPNKTGYFILHENLKKVSK